MKRAFWLINQKRIAVRRAAWRCGVPAQTLRDRLSKGRQYSTPIQGAPTLLSKEAEGKIVQHILKLSSLGYPLSRLEVIALATQSAELLGSRPANGPKLSKRWFERFMGRWPQLKLAKAQKLSIKRAKATSEETVGNYFRELRTIITKHDLESKPHLIYNVDETGFQTEHEPAKAVGGRHQKLNSITSERGALTTVLACGNAVGNSLPPYFVFKGKRDDPRLMAGALPGSRHSMSDTGWSNGEVFKKFLEEHFIPHLPKRDDGQHALLMYVGHASHISLPLIELAKEHNIILFVLPPHTSHALQPLDVGTFKPVKTYYAMECQKEMRRRPGEVITRFDVCRLISAAFLKGVTPSNLINSFKATGIFPLNPDVIRPDHFTTARNLKGNGHNKTVDNSGDMLQSYLASRVPTPTPNTTGKPRTQRKVSFRPAGVAITEPGIIAKLAMSQSNHEATKKTTSVANEDLAGPSGKKQPCITDDSLQQDDNDNCCVCGKFSPEGLKKLKFLKIVDWAKCSYCEHWVHLYFCYDRAMDVVQAKKATITCIHCQDQEE